MKIYEKRLSSMAFTIILSVIFLYGFFSVLSRPYTSFAQGGGGPAIASVSPNYAPVRVNGNPVNSDVVVTLTGFLPGEGITLSLHGGVYATFPLANVNPPRVTALPVYISQTVNADATGMAVVNLLIDDTFPTDIYWFDAIGDVSGPIGNRAGVDTTPLLVIERIRTADLDPGFFGTYTGTVHYTVNSFNNMVALVFPGDPPWANAEQMAEDHADYVMRGITESYQSQVIDWNFRSPPDGNDNFHVVINDGVLNDPFRLYLSPVGNSHTFFRGNFDGNGEKGIHTWWWIRHKRLTA